MSKLSIFLLLFICACGNDHKQSQTNKNPVDKSPPSTITGEPDTTKTNTDPPREPSDVEPTSPPIEQPESAPQPQPVSGFKVKSISGSPSRFCAIDVSDHLWCWGQNELSEIGGLKNSPGLGVKSTAKMVLAARKVESTTTFKHVAVSNDSSCAIDENDELFCWGRNLPAITFGGAEPYLGIGSNESVVDKPTRVVGNRRYMSINSAENATYFLAHAVDNTLYEIGPSGTGLNEPLQVILGAANKFERASISAAKSFLAIDQSMHIWEKKSGGSGLKITDVVKAQSVSGVQKDAYCFVDTAQDIYCYGNNKLFVYQPTFLEVYDYLGVPTAKLATLPLTKLSSPGGVKFKTVTARGGHICALDTNKTLWCFGKNFSTAGGEVGILGTNSTDLVVTTMTKVLDRVSSVAVGEYGQICALMENKKLNCFGENRMRLPSGAHVAGVLGVGSQDAIIKMPTPVAPHIDWREIHIFSDSQEGAALCGIDTNDILYCWGNNGSFAPFGYLGVGSTKNVVDQPMKVLTDTN